MTVDLSQYLNQEVEVTYEDGDTDIGKVTRNTNVQFGLSDLHYYFQGSSNSSSYTKDGFYWTIRGYNAHNIVKIEPIAMSKYEQLENQIRGLQAEVERLKKEEEKTKLPKGFSRENAIAFLEAPSPGKLDLAFPWCKTPQGTNYWGDISSSLIKDSSYKVPQEAIMAIQSWVIESYKEKYGV